MSTKALIIPAAGSGKRLKQRIPKPFLKVGECSILEHTLGRFLPLKGLEQIIVVTSKGFLEETQQMLEEMVPEKVKATVVAGGTERQDSIRNALGALMDVDLVLIHDAVRPFVKLRQIEACCEVAAQTGAALPGIPVKNTLKKIDGEQFVRQTPDRKFIWQAQTPQVFKKQLLIEAYKKAMNENYIGTDDASLVEKLGQRVKMVEGDAANFKITYPVDLKLARLLIEGEQE